MFKMIRTTLITWVLYEIGILGQVGLQNRIDGTIAVNGYSTSRNTIL